MSEVLVDIGCNLTHKQFVSDRSEVIERARGAGVAFQIVTGLTARLSQEALELARSLPEVLCSTAGVHPHNASTFDRHTRGELTVLARAPEVVAVGECGLDYDRDFSPRPAQRQAFETQLEIAAEVGKPVFLHQRSAHDDFTRILENARPRLCGGVVHCFTGSEAEAERYLELGLCIGITGFVCDERRGTHLRDVVKRIPLDRLMVETDAPFLRPRDLPGGTGRRNEPAFLPHVAASVARHVGCSPSEVWRSTTATAFRLFGLAGRFAQPP
ncbi:MAG TPA: TatD family hydrolase [Polyangiaceae bacterium]|nr:TatD family hydrolase [Polyangiaceae bacterium]